MGMGGVQRTLKFAKYLKDYGWESVVVTDNPKKYYAVDESLLKEAIDCGISIERTGKEPFNIKDILSVVIISIERIFGMSDAVFAIGCHRLISMIGRIRGWPSTWLWLSPTFRTPIFS